MMFSTPFLKSIIQQEPTPKIKNVFAQITKEEQQCFLSKSNEDKEPQGAAFCETTPIAEQLVLIA